MGLIVIRKLLLFSFCMIYKFYVYANFLVLNASIVYLSPNARYNKMNV